MKNTAVSNVNAYLTQTAVKRQETDARRNASSLMGTFNQVLSDTTGKSAGSASLKNAETVKEPLPKPEQTEQSKADQPKADQTDKTQEQQKPEKDSQAQEPEDGKVSGPETDKTAGAGGEKEDPEITQALKEAVEKVKDAIKDQFGVSEEELLKAMEMLGLKPEDLLIAAKINELAAVLTGSQDALNLITDGNLYDQLKAVLDVVSQVTDDLKEQLGLSDQQFQAMLEQAVRADGEQTLTEAGANAEAAGEKAADTPGGPVVEVVNTGKETAGTAAEQALNQENAAASGEDIPDESADTMTPVRRTHQEGTAGGETGNESQNSYAGGTAQQSLFQNSAPVENRMANQPLPQFADTQEIINQIAERIRIVVSPEVSEMEMQLKPESLGNLHLQIAVKNGAMTAQFTAENEAVKHVLETQMIQLRENLNNQGVRVEAVEVTVASHEFERNLQQDAKGGNARENAQGERHRIRGINLDEIGDLDEADLTQEERLAAEVMLQSGSTVDYIA